MLDHVAVPNGRVALLDSIQRFVTTPKHIFFLALLVATGSSLCYLFFVYDIYRDAANAYAYCARELGHGNFAEGLSTRIPMLNVLLAGGLTAAGLKAFTACVLVSSCFYIAALFPLRAYLERYLSPLQAAWGCLLYAAAPKMIRYSCTGLIDSGRVFFLIVALLYFFRSIEKPTWKNAVLLGIGLGGLAVSRGEGLPAALCALVGVPILAAIRHASLEPASIQKRIMHFAVTLLFFLLATMPFCLINYQLTGYYVTDLRIVEALNPALAPEAVPAVAMTIAERFSAMASNFSRGAYEPYLIFGAIGILLTLFKRKWNWDYTVLVLLTLLNAAIYFQIVTAYRYYIFLIPMFMMFTIGGLTPFVQFVARRGRLTRMAAAAVAVSILASQLVNGIEMAFTRKDRPYRELAAYIQEYAKDAQLSGKLRLAAPELPEVSYWSEAFPVTGYNQPLIKDYAAFADFDLLLLTPDYEEFNLVSERGDLERVADTPHPTEFIFFRKKEGVRQ